jgi:hypothetical protein
MIEQSSEMSMSSAETSKSGPVAIACSDAKSSSETSSFGEMLLAIAVASRRSWRNAVTARSGKIGFRGQISGTAWAAFAVLLLGLAAASAEPCRLSGSRYGLVGEIPVVICH